MAAQNEGRYESPVHALLLTGFAIHSAVCDARAGESPVSITADDGIDPSAGCWRRCVEACDYSMQRIEACDSLQTSFRHEVRVL